MVHNYAAIPSKAPKEIASTYDDRSRPLTRTIVAGSTYWFDYAYNTLGQLDTLTDLAPVVETTGQVELLPDQSVPPTLN